MKKSAKTVIRNNNTNNVKKFRKVEITHVPYRGWNIAICNLSGYTFALNRILKKDCLYGDIDVEPRRLVLTAQNAAGETKIVRCLNETLYHANLIFEKLKEEGFAKKHRLYELCESYVDSVEMDLYYAQCDYDFEEDILQDAFDGRSRINVNFINRNKLVCRL